MYYIIVADLERLLYLLETTDGGGPRLEPPRLLKLGVLEFFAISTLMLQPHTFLPSICWMASSASLASSNSMKANPGGLRATQTLFSGPKCSNSFSSSCFEPFGPKSPIYTLAMMKEKRGDSQNGGLMLCLFSAFLSVLTYSVLFCTCARLKHAPNMCTNLQILTCDYNWNCLIAQW